MSSLGAATDGLTLGGATRYPSGGAGKRTNWRDRPCIEPGEVMQRHVREKRPLPDVAAAAAAVRKDSDSRVRQSLRRLRRTQT